MNPRAFRSSKGHDDMFVTFQLEVVCITVFYGYLLNIHPHGDVYKCVIYEFPVFSPIFCDRLQGMLEKKGGCCKTSIRGSNSLF